MRIWFRFLVIYFLLAAAAAYVSAHQEIPQPLAKPLAAFPSIFGSWRGGPQQFFSHELLAKLRPSDYLARTYSDAAGNAVGLYIGYHDGGQGSGPIHSPKNCLPGSGWLELFSRPLVLTLSGKPRELTQALYQGRDHTELFVYWFIVNGHVYSSETGLKLAEIVNSVRNGRRGAAFVRLNMDSKDDPAKAKAVLEDFLRQAYPAIQAAF